VTNDRGFSLLETMIALLIMLMILLSVAQLFGMSVAVNKAADDITLVTSLASEMVERLKFQGYDALTAGGSLVTDTTGFFDSPSVDEDVAAEFTRRWLVTDNGDSMQIQVRVVATSQAQGLTKETTVTAIVADR
jgi:prepilin-type N-terminal cleavage/methylation domain-containing protein